jgi:hypothetical protein
VRIWCVEVAWLGLFCVVMKSLLVVIVYDQNINLQKQADSGEKYIAMQM